MQIPKKPLDSKAKLLPRTVLKDIKKALFDRDILVLTGARQVGKTSIIYLIYRHLIKEKKVAPQNILFFDLEDIQTLEVVEKCSFDDFAKYITEEGKQGKKFVFIDEIQYLKEPSSFLKVLHDHYPSLKLIVSGSSSLAMKRKFKDSLTGRKHIFAIQGLSFEEYLQFKNIKLQRYNFRNLFENKKFSTDEAVQKEIEKTFEQFAICGGYPEVSLLSDFEKKTAKLREIYTSYIKKDIKDLMSIENVTGFNKLVSLAAHQTGNLMNVDELANSSGLARDTVSKYLLILENTFVIDLVYPYFTNKRKEITKMPKVYFKDLGLCNVITRNFNPIENRGERGAIIENVVFNELSKNRAPSEEIKFWRTQTKQEIDFIIEGKELIPVEVKYQMFARAKIPTSIKGFIRTYKPKQGIVFTKNFSSILQYEKTKIYFLPAWTV